MLPNRTVGIAKPISLSAAINELKQFDGKRTRVDAEIKILIQELSQLNEDINHTQERKLAVALLQKLNQFMRDQNFTRLEVNTNKMADSLYHASLAVAQVYPNNLVDIITLEPIAPKKAVFTSDGSQFDIINLIQWINKVEGKSGDAKFVHPYLPTKTFIQKDIETIKIAAKIYKKENPSTPALNLQAIEQVTKKAVEEKLTEQKLASLLENDTAEHKSSRSHFERHRGDYVSDHDPIVQVLLESSQSFFYSQPTIVEYKSAALELEAKAPAKATNLVVAAPYIEVGNLTADEATRLNEAEIDILKQRGHDWINDNINQLRELQVVLLQSITEKREEKHSSPKLPVYQPEYKAILDSLLTLQEHCKNLCILQVTKDMGQTRLLDTLMQIKNLSNELTGQDELSTYYKKINPHLKAFLTEATKKAPDAEQLSISASMLCSAIETDTNLSLEQKKTEYSTRQVEIKRDSLNESKISSEIYTVPQKNCSIMLETIEQLIDQNKIELLLDADKEKIKGFIKTKDSYIPTSLNTCLRNIEACLRNVMKNILAKNKLSSDTTIDKLEWNDLTKINKQDEQYFALVYLAVQTRQAKQFDVWQEWMESNLAQHKSISTMGRKR